MCLDQTPGRRPSHITGRFVNTVSRGWVGALKSAPPSDFMAQSLALSIEFCRGPRISPLEMNFCLRFLRPRSAQNVFFFGVFETCDTFFSMVCAQSERYINLLSGVFEIRTYFWQHRVSIVTGLGIPTFEI